MTIKTVICDICGAEPAVPVSIAVGKYQDNAGSIETDVKTFDLCLTHAKELACDALRTVEEAERDKICAWLKGRCAARKARLV